MFEVKILHTGCVFRAVTCCCRMKPVQQLNIEPDGSKQVSEVKQDMAAAASAQRGTAGYYMEIT